MYFITHYLNNEIVSSYFSMKQQYCKKWWEIRPYLDMRYLPCFHEASLNRKAK